MKKSFDQLMRPGVTVHMRYPDKANPNNETRHIRAIVDRKEVIYRIWDHGRWKYSMDTIQFFKLLYDNGVLRNGS